MVVFPRGAKPPANLKDWCMRRDTRRIVMWSCRLEQRLVSQPVVPEVFRLGLAGNRHFMASFFSTSPRPSCAPPSCLHLSTMALLSDTAIDGLVARRTVTRSNGYGSRLSRTHRPSTSSQNYGKESSQFSRQTTLTCFFRAWKRSRRKRRARTHWISF